MSIDDARRGERRALLPTAMILILAFGALVAAVIPIVIALYAISCLWPRCISPARFFPWRFSSFQSSPWWVSGWASITPCSWSRGSGRK